MTMTTREDVLGVITRYFRAIETSDRAAIEELLDERIVAEELPNRLRPQGGTADRAAMLAGFERGKGSVRAQTYTVESAVVEGERAALQVHWSGTLARAFGSLQAGDTMRAHFAVFIEVRGGRIVSQRNYDCFDAF
jgi:ketosteroid isomerase-like protein